MPNNKNAESEIRDCVDRFVGELTALVQQSTIESIQDAIGSSLQAPQRPGRRVSKPAKARASGPKKRIRRSTANVEAVAAKVAAHVKSNPGCSISEIGAALGASSKDLRLPIQKLMADGVIKTVGQKRGTRYHPGKDGGAAPSKRTRKKASSRKKKSSSKKRPAAKKKAASKK